MFIFALVPDHWHENICDTCLDRLALFVSGTRQGAHAFHAKSDGGYVATEVLKNADVVDVYEFGGLRLRSSVFRRSISL